jgi:hypothetical protein
LNIWLGQLQSWKKIKIKKPLNHKQAEAADETVHSKSVYSRKALQLPRTWKVQLQTQEKETQKLHRRTDKVSTASSTTVQLPRKEQQTQEKEIRHQIRRSLWNYQTTHARQPVVVTNRIYYYPLNTSA